MATLLKRRKKRTPRQESSAGNNGANTPLATDSTQAAASELAQLFKLLADDTRLKILFFLVQRAEINVRTLCELLGQSQPAVSHHLALLRVAGLIEARRDGKHNFYRLLPARFEDVLHLVFAHAPGPNREIKFTNYELLFRQLPSRAAPATAD